MDEEIKDSEKKEDSSSKNSPVPKKNTLIIIMILITIIIIFSSIAGPPPTSNNKANPKEKYYSDRLSEYVSINDFQNLVVFAYCEAGNLSFEEQTYYVSIVINRVLSNEFPNDINSVIMQDGQFACILNKKFTLNGIYINYNDIPKYLVESISNAVEQALDIDLASGSVYY